MNKLEGKAFQNFATAELYKELIEEKLGTAKHDKESLEKREKMKAFLRERYGTDNIEMVDKEQIDEDLKGDKLISRIDYRKGAGGLKKLVIAKKQKYSKEGLKAENLGAEMKNPDFGFQCIHYSVSEAIGKIQIPILNKTKNACKVRVKTLGNTDTALATATPNEDYESIDMEIEFK